LGYDEIAELLQQPAAAFAPASGEK